MRMPVASRNLRLAALASAVSTILGAPAALAQAQQGLDEITVTGTRIVRDEFSSTNATQSITAEDMQRLGLVTAADMLAQLPANVGTYQLDMDGSETSFNVGSTIANLRGMNTAQGTRTLVLIDGQRQVQTTNGGNFDLSFVPSILISRMEAVTGGASATYGSDATAGVVNIILDRNVQGIRLDASFGQNKDGNLRQYSVSVASGVNNLLQGKGSLTVSYEHQVTDPTASCGEIFDWCAKGATLINTTTGSQLYRIDPVTGAEVACGALFQAFCTGVIAPRSRLFPDEDFPHNMFVENMRLLHEATSWGSLHTPGPRRPNTTSTTPGAMVGSTDPTAEQFLQWNQEGTALIPFQENLDPLWREYAWGGRTRRVQGGDGPLTTVGSPTRNGQERDNIFANFRWEATDDITVNTRFTYGVTTGEQIRNAPRNMHSQFCVYLPTRAGQAAVAAVPGAGQAAVPAIAFGGPLGAANVMGSGLAALLIPGTATGQATGNPEYDGNPAYAGHFWQSLNPPAGGNVPRLWRNMGPMNGFLDPRAPNPMDPSVLNVLLDRQLTFAGTGNDPNGYTQCSIGTPQLAGITASTTSFTGDSNAFQIRPGIRMEKNYTGLVDRRILTDTTQYSFNISANGPLFGNDRWTWNGNIQFGKSDREQYRTDQQRGFRFSMAADAVYDPEANGGQGGVVCRVNASDAVGGRDTREVYRNYIMGLSSSDVYAASVGGLVNGQPVLISEAQLRKGDEQVDLLREGCQPLNPFGQGYKTGDAADMARQMAALEYAFSDQIEISESEQLIGSFSISGQLWKGFGAGPISMATGVDFRDADTFNFNESAGGGAPIVRTDFATQYGDPWSGSNGAMELFAEFELPLVRDRIGARYLTVNFTGRRTQSSSDRVTRPGQETTFATGANRDYSDKRYGSSWRASLNWAITDSVRLRTTRSMDIRNPSSRELFSSVTTLSGGFGRLGNTTTVWNPWSKDNAGGNEISDDYSSIRGGNEGLENEGSTTTTLGLVFTPGGWASGLSLSADYSELRVSGGISYLDSFSGSGTTADEEEDRLTTDDGDSLNQLPYPIYQCYATNDPFWCSKVIFNPDGAPEEPNVDGIDPYGPFCQAMQDCVARTDIVAYYNLPFNSEPYWTRNLDLSASYNLQLDGGGSLSMRLLATRALEQSRCTQVILSTVTLEASCAENARINIIGVTGSGGGSQGFTNFTSQPKWSGNFYVSYSRQAFSLTTQARYTGKGVQSLSVAQQQLLQGGSQPNTYGSWYDMFLPSWTTWNLTASYNFARSRIAPERFENLQLSLTIDNLFDKQPDSDYYSCSSCTGGVNTRFYNGNGRTFRLNFRSQF